MDRIRNPKIMEAYRSRECEVCSSSNLVSGHHIKSRGAFGADVANNLVALCFNCHTAVHKMGVEKFIQKNPIYKTIITNKGFEYVEEKGKYVNWAIERLCNGIDSGDDQASAV